MRYIPYFWVEYWIWVWVLMLCLTLLKQSGPSVRLPWDMSVMMMMDWFIKVVYSLYMPISLIIARRRWRDVLWAFVGDVMEVRPSPSQKWLG